MSLENGSVTRLVAPSHPLLYMQIIISKAEAGYFTEDHNVPYDRSHNSALETATKAKYDGWLLNKILVKEGWVPNVHQPDVVELSISAQMDRPAQCIK